MFLVGRRLFRRGRPSSSPRSAIFIVIVDSCRIPSAKVFDSAKPEYPLNNLLIYWLSARIGRVTPGIEIRVTHTESTITEASTRETVKTYLLVSNCGEPVVQK